MAESDFELVEVEEAKVYIQENGISKIEEFFKRQLEKWKDAVVDIGITGDSGVGKSSFINAIRSLPDDDEMAAKTGVKQTTTKPSCYPHPTNSKIRFWDLPGIGTPEYPVETYSEKVQLKKYDTFLILTTCRFTDDDLILAKKIRSTGKKFFFIRTKIDIDYNAEKRKKAFDEKTMLKEIKDDCSKYLEGYLDSTEHVFLISSHFPEKWEFARLTQAILDVLPIRQRESLILSLGVLTSRSSGFLQRKVEVLKSRIWMVASASAAAALVPLPGLSTMVDLALIAKEVRFYRLQLGLSNDVVKAPGPELAKTILAMQKRGLKFCFATATADTATLATQLARFTAVYSSEAAIEEFVRFIPLIGTAMAGGMSFGATYYFLKCCLEEYEKVALSVLQDISTSSVV